MFVFLQWQPTLSISTFSLLLQHSSFSWDWSLVSRFQLIIMKSNFFSFTAAGGFYIHFSTSDHPPNDNWFFPSSLEAPTSMDDFHSAIPFDLPRFLSLPPRSWLLFRPHNRMPCPNPKSIVFTPCHKLSSRIFPKEEVFCCIYPALHSFVENKTVMAELNNSRRPYLTSECYLACWPPCYQNFKKMVECGKVALCSSCCNRLEREPNPLFWAF